MTQLLKDRVILVTGGSEGIGWDCAKAYKAQGAKVVVVARSEEKVAAAAAGLGPGHLGLPCDVSDDASVAAMMKTVLERFGRLDAIHNNAGIATPSKALHETTPEEWDAVFNINLRSVLHTTRHGFEALKASRGSILNTSSMVGVIGQDLHAAYTATKGGMNTLTMSMALDYAPHGIRVNAVCPAVIDTDMFRRAYEADPRKADYAAAVHPVGRIGTVEEVASAVLYLCSEGAAFITGHALAVDGGAMAI